jgi:MinD-like ATPase involved in chromosome partitioning or flagellar assembly
VHWWTGGLIDPGPGADELARRALLHRIRTPLPGAHRVAVTSIKGGVGKTTVAACLGLVLAEHRGDRVVALDANPDAGTLADRLTGESSVTVRELLRDQEHVRSWSDMSRYLSLAGRLQVVASEQDPASGDAFSREEYEQVSALLGQFFDIAVTDSGTGLVHSAMEGTLALADSLVVVGAPTVDGASRAAKTLDWLHAHGHAGLATDAVVVLSHDRASSDVDGGRIRAYFAARCRGVVDVPHDPHLASGGRIDLPGCASRPARRSFTSPPSWRTASRSGPRCRTGGCPAGTRVAGLPWKGEHAPRPGESLGLQHARARQASRGHARVPPRHPRAGDDPPDRPGCPGPCPKGHRSRWTCGSSRSSRASTSPDGVGSLGRRVLALPRRADRPPDRGHR